MPGCQPTRCKMSNEMSTAMERSPPGERMANTSRWSRSRIRTIEDSHQNQNPTYTLYTSPEISIGLPVSLIIHQYRILDQSTPAANGVDERV